MYTIHPPVLSDRGLLEAIEAQSSRLAVPMAVRADPGLRGVRFGEQIEATAWYVLAEALSNVVKHAGASEVEVSLSRCGSSLPTTTTWCGRACGGCSRSPALLVIALKDLRTRETSSGVPAWLAKTRL